MADDLRTAAALGMLVLARPVADGVDLSGRVLRYDPALPQRHRARLVRAALGRAGLLPMRQSDAGGLDGVNRLLPHGRSVRFCLFSALAGRGRCRNSRDLIFVNRRARQISGGGQNTPALFSKRP